MSNNETDNQTFEYAENDRLAFTELIDVKACKYVASRTFEQFKSEFCTGEWKTSEGEQIAQNVRV